MSGYRELIIHSESRKIAIRVHHLSLKLPKYELYEEGSQLRRSSKAVTALIVEGYGRRRYKADYIKYLVYALAECDETIVHLDFLLETVEPELKSEFLQMVEDYDKLSRQINKYIRFVEDEWRS